MCFCAKKVSGLMKKSFAGALKAFKQVILGLLVEYGHYSTRDSHYFVSQALS